MGVYMYVFTWTNHVLKFECASVSFAYEGEFILEAEYRETFSAPQIQEMPGRVHFASHNLLIPPRHPPRATSYFVSSPLISFHTLCSYLCVSFNFFSPRCFFQTGWQERRFESPIFCSEWSLTRITAGFQCFCSVPSSLSFKHIYKQKAPRKLQHLVWSYVTPKACVHVRRHTACFVCNMGGCCHKCNLRCNSNAAMMNWKQWVVTGRWGNWVEVTHRT